MRSRRTVAACLAAALLFVPAASMARNPEAGSALEPLLREIEEVSSLVIARDDACPWSRLELESILEVLHLPREMRFQKRIVVKKENSIFVPGTSRGDLVETSVWKREIRLKSYRAGDILPGDPELSHRSFLRRALLLNLALLF